MLLTLSAVILRNVPSVNCEVQPTTAAAIALPAPQLRTVRPPAAGVLLACLLPAPQPHTHKPSFPGLENCVLPSPFQGRDLSIPGSFSTQHKSARGRGGREGVSCTLQQLRADGKAGEGFTGAPIPSPRCASIPSPRCAPIPPPQCAPARSPAVRSPQCPACLWAQNQRLAKQRLNAKGHA